MRRLGPLIAALALAACATTPIPVAAPAPLAEGWTRPVATSQRVGLGMPGGVRLAPGVRFAGGVEIKAPAGTPLHSLSDLKLTSEDGFVSVTDAGDLVRGRIVLDRRGRLTDVVDLRFRRLTLADGAPIVDKRDGDAEGLAITSACDLLVSFERDHRIWNYGRDEAPRARPTPERIPDFAFTTNDGMEGLAASDRGWIAAGESGGVWDCNAEACLTLVPPPEIPLTDAQFRITGLDADPWGQGWWAVQRSFSEPADVRGQVRRLAPDGTLGPVLVTLSLPSTVDNFEGIAVRRRNGGARVYILSDDNDRALQRTLLLAFDIAEGSRF